MTANSFGSLATLRVGEAGYQIHRLDAVDGSADLPFSLKILLENLLRTEDGREHHRRARQRARAVGPGGRARRSRSSSPRPGCSCRT